MKTQAWRHVGFALLLMLALAGVRYATSSNDGLDKIEQFEMSSGTDVGPDVAFFGAGLHGDAATAVIVALDPLGRDLGRSLHEPAYRYSRFGYPWLSKAVVGGVDGIILLGLSVVGFLSAGGLAFMASRLNDRLGWRSWLLIANPALLLGVLNDTTEPLALLVLTLALMTGSVVLALATGAGRENYIVAFMGGLRLFIAGLFLVVAVRALWTWHFDDSFFSGGQNVDWPLVGILEYPSLLGWLVILAGLATAIIGLVRRDLGWITGGAFVLIFAAGVFHTPTNAVRAAGYLPVLWAFGPNWKQSRATTQTSHVVDDH